MPYLILNNPPGNLPTAPDSVHTPSGPLPRHTGHTRVPLSKHHLSWYVIRIRLSVRWHTLWCSRLVIRVEDVTKRLTPVIRGVFTGYTTSLFYLPKVGLRQRNHSMPTNTDKSDPTKNRLLAALPREEYERISHLNILRRGGGRCSRTKRDVSPAPPSAETRRLL